jgi:hypothetical protein
LWLWAAALLLAAACVAGSAQAGTWTVSTVSQLNSALGGYASGDEIVILPGTYNLTQRLIFTRPNVTIRGSTGRRDDVWLVGGGMNTNSEVREGIDISTDDVTVRDLSLKEFWNFAFHVRAENDADRYHIANVHTLNCGERQIKGSYNSATPQYRSDDCIIENVFMENNKIPSGHSDNNYIGGIDAMGINNIIVRNCVAKDIKGASGGGRGGIFLWNEVYNPTVENNSIIGCDRGIALGNPGYSGTSPWAVDSGIVRNNFITRGVDIGLELCFTKDVKIDNNTLYGSDADYSRAVHLYGASTTNLQSNYNAIRGQVSANGANWTPVGNIVGATVGTDWFANPTAGDLHLTEAAAAAIGHALTLADVPVDFDREGRPYGSHPDVGGDEWRLAGDTNLDLDTDFTDYQALERNFGGTTGKTWAQGDFDHDGDVDFTDYQALELNFGRVLNPANYDVPEPASVMLLLVGAAVAWRKGRRPR